MIKDTARTLLDLIRHNVFLPSHAWACLRRPGPQGGEFWTGSVQEHLRAAMDWIRRAYTAASKNGVAARYTLKDGWLAPYPETTGYIIPTLFSYSLISGERHYHTMALGLADWLMKIQLESGGFPGGHLDQNQGPVVFNTGQILIGLLEAYRRSRNDRYLDAALGAGRWLKEVQDEDGAWRRFAYKNRLHAYHTRVAWPLVDLGVLAGEGTLVDAGRANLDFSLTLQQENGWFQENTLDEEEIPFTHTLAYVARGMLEAGEILEESRYIESAHRLGRALLEDFERRGYLGGQYDRSFTPNIRFSCLTGNAQMALVWMKLDRLGMGEVERYTDAARRILRQVMYCQDIHADHPGIRGGVPGSWPLWGPYIRFGYPNWAAKFLADALMLSLEVSPIS
jgi:hypothetical protein